MMEEVNWALLLAGGVFVLNYILSLFDKREVTKEKSTRNGEFHYPL